MDTHFSHFYLLLFLHEIVIALVILFFVQKFIKKDYNAFIALGPGGTPSTPSGYLRICLLKLFALRNPFVPPPVPPTLYPQRGLLRKLPTRKGTRPKVVGLAPQRQMDQKGGEQMYTRLVNAIRELAADYPERLFLGTSCFEKHSEGIFSSHVADRFTCRGEVCHSHPSDGSMHLTLHPADVKVVLDQGWGERHPLARDNWWWRPKIVPASFMMIYAPRDEEELNTAIEIVRAAAWWIGGKELKKKRVLGTIVLED
jgi:hypothetical protein